MRKNLGLLAAMAIGDSFGRSFEFATKDKINPDLDLTVYHPSVGKYSESYKGGIGKYTDDTQMAIAIAEHMLADKAFTADAYAESLIEAFERDKRDGYSRRFLDILNKSYNAQTFQHNIGVQKPRNSNGSVIRCLPLGLYPDVNMVKHACIVQCCLTHPTMECIVASQLLALAVHYSYYGHPKKTFQNWITDHLPFGMVNTIMMKYSLGDQIECDAIETVSYCLNVAFNQTKFKKLVVMPPKVKEERSYNGHGGAVASTYTTWTQPTPPDATMAEILKHSIVEVGGDTDSTAAIGLGLATLRGAKNDLNINLFNNLENGIYGRDYLMDLDRRLMEKFPKVPVKQEKIKIKVETIAEREARELAEKMPPIHELDKECTCSKCKNEKSETIKDKKVHKGLHINSDDYEGMAYFYGYGGW